MKIVLYPGTFDPIHRGHVDICEKASKIFDKVIFSVAENPNKKTLFTAQERVDMIVDATGHINNVETMSTTGLIANFAKEMNAVGLIRGLRHVSDFEFEFQMAMMNNHLNEDVSTLLMVTAEQYIHINSTMIKNVAGLGGDITDYVTENVMDQLLLKLNK